MLLAALARPERVAGLLGIAPAPDFTEDLSWPSLTPAQQAAIIEEGRVEMPNPYSETPYVYSRRLFEDGRRHLLLGGPIPLRMPVRILHGQNDEAVPWQRSLTLMDRLDSDDVEATFVKGGDHRLSEPRDLDRLGRTLDALLATLETAP
jgi:pimeloyl-ACP methyl ester carboxylesterase